MRLYMKLAVAGLAVGLITGSFALGAKYEAGRAAVERDELLLREKERLDGIWAGELERATQRHEERIRALQQQKEIRREIPAVVTPECADLGPDWVGLHNRAVDAANRSAVPD